jgi:hypothetical protein
MSEATMWVENIEFLLATLENAVDHFERDGVLQATPSVNYWIILAALHSKTPLIIAIGGVLLHVPQRKKTAGPRLKTAPLACQEYYFEVLYFHVALAGIDLTTRSRAPLIATVDLMAMGRRDPCALRTRGAVRATVGKLANLNIE